MYYVDDIADNIFIGLITLGAISGVVMAIIFWKETLAILAGAMVLFLAGLLCYGIGTLITKYVFKD